MVFEGDKSRLCICWPHLNIWYLLYLLHVGKSKDAQRVRVQPSPRLWEEVLVPSLHKQNKLLVLGLESHVASQKLGVVDVGCLIHQEIHLYPSLSVHQLQDVPDLDSQHLHSVEPRVPSEDGCHLVECVQVALISCCDDGHVQI